MKIDPETFTLDQIGLDENTASIFAQAHRPIETEDEAGDEVRKYEVPAKAIIYKLSNGSAQESEVEATEELLNELTEMDGKYKSVLELLRSSND